MQNFTGKTVFNMRFLVAIVFLLAVESRGWPPVAPVIAYLCSLFHASIT